jgi:hypothetical protein
MRSGTERVGFMIWPTYGSSRECRHAAVGAAGWLAHARSAGQALAERAQQRCAVAPLRIAMHACQGIRLLARKIFDQRLRTSRVRKVIHLLSKCFA